MVPSTAVTPVERFHINHNASAPRARALIYLMALTFVILF